MNLAHAGAENNCLDAVAVHDVSVGAAAAGNDVGLKTHVLDVAADILNEVAFNIYGVADVTIGVAVVGI